MRESAPRMLAFQAPKMSKNNRHDEVFLSLGTADIWDQIILCGGNCPVHGGTLSSIAGLFFF